MKRIPWSLLVPVALLLAIAPFGRQPHLVEKVGMLMAGTLRRPIDVFDLFLHGTPFALLIVKVASSLRARS